MSINIPVGIMKLIIFDKQTGQEITDPEEIIKHSDLALGVRFESFGIQSDGQPVIFDKCGRFGYLDTDKVRVGIGLF
jgi:hypothetical protein